MIVLLETDLRPARVLAETLRDALERKAIPHAASAVSTVVTASFGISAQLAHLTTFEHLLSAADKALYLAKTRGRNKVMFARPIVAH